jgi:hypothetical protein
MKTIWVLENTKKDKKFFLQEVELICLIASVVNWKALYPDCKTSLYACPSVFSYLEDLDILDIWDSIDVEELSKDDSVNRRAFWAASKLKCIKNIEAPFVLMDCDLYFKRKFFELEDLSQFDIVVNQIEEGANVYPSIRDRILSGIVNRYPIKYGWRTTHSPNVSFLYIKDEIFKNEYVETAWEWMDDLSQRFWDDPDLNGKYMIFCEQKLLKEISDLRGMKMAALSHNFYFNEERKIEKLPDSYGTFFLDGTLDYFHLHNKKRLVLSDKNLFLDIRSDIIQSIMDLNSFSMKLLYQILLKNKEIAGPLL